MKLTALGGLMKSLFKEAAENLGIESDFLSRSMNNTVYWETCILG